jgi:predicted HTH transcriptional regulator
MRMTRCSVAPESSLALRGGTEKARVPDVREPNGDIVENAKDAIVFPKKHPRMSRVINDGLGRESVSELPEDAVPEAAVNAARRGDHSEKGSPRHGRDF